MVDVVHARVTSTYIASVRHRQTVRRAVVKEQLNLKDQLVNGKYPCRRADETYLKEIEASRERDLAEIEAEGGGNIQIQVDVVDIVKAT